MKISGKKTLNYEEMHVNTILSHNKQNSSIYMKLWQVVVNNGTGTKINKWHSAAVCDVLKLCWLPALSTQLHIITRCGFERSHLRTARSLSHNFTCSPT